jgi:RNA polymerase sigma-70 factor (ECF subfamily)
MGDLDLARRVLAGDESASEEFFREYFARLYRFALARVAADEDAAEELVQRTLIRAVRKLHTYRGEAALFTWLCTMCRREISTWREHTGRRAETTLLEDHPDVRIALEAAARLAADPERDLERRDLSRLVQLTLDHLPDRYAQVLRWKYVHELSVDEIANRLALGYKAAESLLTRARQAFRDAFELTAGRWRQAAALDRGPEGR